ncbi:MAG: DUF2442 domain-containing protein [Methylococcaceae bacterium]|nr:MAG: DUF2442 domain-containing protein [Methylococcaceae bacterium]
MLTEGAVINVVGAEYLHNYMLKVSFSDGAARVIDFGAFLSKSFHPQIRRYLDKSKFITFSVENGDLVWGECDLCFPVADLYENNIC